MEFLAVYQAILEKNGVFASLDAELDMPYEDLSQEEWGWEVVSNTEDNLRARGKSLAQVFPGRIFGGETPILRQEVVKLLALVTPEQVGDSEAVFSDLTPETDFQALGQVVAHGIFMGYPDGTFHLQDGLTRAEATIVLQRLAVKLEIFDDDATSKLLIPMTIYDNAYLSFGQYDDLAEKDEDGTWTDDGRYLRVMRTLEYLSFDQQIPYSEKKLYDDQPVSTLVSLRTGDYWNRIGVDYYLLGAADFTEEEEAMLAEEIFLAYMIRDDLSFVESKQLFQRYSSKITDLSLLENGYAFWNSQLTSPVERFTMYTMQAVDYLARGYAMEARMGYEWMRSQTQGGLGSAYWIFEDPEIQRMFIANMIYMDDHIGSMRSVDNLIQWIRKDLAESDMTEADKAKAEDIVSELENRYHWEKIKVLP
jgi:hypothetical protein